MDDMLSEFVTEALELVAEAEDNLLVLSQQPGKHDLVNAVFRAFHTIKGGAGFMNLPGMANACHLTENLLDALRSGQTPVSAQAVDAALQANWFVADQLVALSKGSEPAALPAITDALQLQLRQAIVMQQDQAQSAPEPAALDAPAQGMAPVVADGSPDWLAFYQALLPPTLAQPAVTAVPLAQPERKPQSALNSEPLRVPEPALASAPAVALAPPPAFAPAALAGEDPAPEVSLANGKEDSLRVKANKLDALLDVAGESVQASNQASALLDKLMPFKQEPAAANLMAALSETLARAARYTSELQRATLATRMQPVGRLFQRFPRLVRELARDLDKNVELVIEGAETEVDRIVVDSLYEPLVHMLRNSLDHGVEHAPTRLAQGKPAKARIFLRARQEASSVVIEVADDGAGVDPQRLLKKAIAMNLVHEPSHLTREEVLQLMFLPGLSTKDTTSSVSGRGVGMDVVKTSVEKNRGSIKIESELGAGTCFSIRLPIELSIIPTLLVSAGEVLVGMPMSAVQRVIELPDQYKEVGGAKVFKDQGCPLPVRSLAGVLGYQPALERVGIVVVAPKPYILGVCAVEGTADLVIKPLTALAARGIAGTARSAEGSLVLILDLEFLQARSQ